DEMVSPSEIRPSPLVVQRVQCAGSVCQHDGNVLRLPRAGAFERLTYGFQRELIEALADPASGEVWIDRDHDRDFAEEPVITEERGSRPDVLVNGMPVFASRHNPDGELRLYVPSDTHVDMTAGVAAGAAVPYGVAPNAQLLFVRVGMLLSGYVEG